jgi:putative flippase GtrA
MKVRGPRPAPEPAPRSSPRRHWTGFLLGGAVAFGVDSAVTMLLTRLVGAPVLIARLAAISLAMIASWLINRTITFPVAGPPSLPEFARFAAVAWMAAALNYAMFAAVIFLVPALHPVAAIAIASLAAMAFSYLGMRFGVFNT